MSSLFRRHFRRAALALLLLALACNTEPVRAEPGETYRGLPPLSEMFRVPRWSAFRGDGSTVGIVHAEKRYRILFRGFGNWSSLGNSGESEDMDFNAYGFSLGVDQQIGHRWLMGASVGSTRISAQGKLLERQNRHDFDASAMHGMVFVRKTWDKLYVDLETSFGENEQTGRFRNAAFTGSQWHFNAETGTWWGQGLAKIEPFFGIRYASLETEPGTETKTTLVGGLRYFWSTAGKYGRTSPRLYGGVLQELGDKHLMNAGTLIDSPTVFAVPGYEMAATRFFFGGGLTSTLGRSLALSFRYTAEVASSYASHTLLLGMNWNF